MKDSVRLGRIAGVRVGLNWSLLVMVALIAGGLADNRFVYDAPGYSGTTYALAGGLTALGLLFGVLLHELGHALVARRVGLEVHGITLSWMGGVTRIEGEAPRPGAEMLVAGIGPVVSAAFGGALWVVRTLVSTAGGDRLALAALGWLAVINVVLALFNLLPAAPLDGGRVLHSTVWALTGNRWRATRASAGTGILFGATMAAAGFVLMLRSTDPLNGLLISFVGWWLLGSARVERASGALHHALDGVRVADIMRPVGAAPGWVTVRTFSEQYASRKPGWVWLLERWGGGYEGILLGDALTSVPLPQWDLVRPLDVAVPVAAAASASPDEDLLDVVSRTAGKQLILVVHDSHTLGAVLPADIEALVKMGPGRPVPYGSWTLTRG